MNYLALGDSYTIGENVKQQNSFPYQLKQQLNVEQVKVIAQTGWTTKDLLKQIQKENLNQSYDFVSLLIGVNNQYQGKSRNEYITELELLIKIGIQKVKNTKHFFLMTIPNYGDTPFGNTWHSYITKDLNWYNTQIIKLGNKYQLPIVDITSVSKETKVNEKLLTSDLLHPSKQLYSFWVQEIMTVINS